MILISLNKVSGIGSKLFDSIIFRQYFTPGDTLIVILMLIVVNVTLFGEPRTIIFSGYKWKVKSSQDRVGPGSNYFSDSKKNVWIDEEDRLHLKIRYSKGKWWCSEIICQEQLGWGKYTLFVDSRIDTLNKNTMLGFFTYDKSPKKHHREIDIEFSRWDSAGGKNAQYVIQPYNEEGNLNRFDFRLSGEHSTHGFIWNPTNIFFYSYYGHYIYPPGKEAIINLWNYKSGTIPGPGNSKVRINLYLLPDKEDVKKESVEVIIKAFKYSKCSM